MFHHFHGVGHAQSVGSITAQRFAEIIEFVGRNRILPAKEWMRKAQTHSLGRDDICITFDDSLRCQYDIAYPVMRDLGLTGFWFVYTSVMEGDIGYLEVYREFRNSQFDNIGDFYREFLRTLSHSEHGATTLNALKSFRPAQYLTEFAFYSDEDRRFRYVRDELLGPVKFHTIMGRLMAEAGFNAAKIAEKLWLDDSCLTQLHSEGHVIGLHSHTHPTQLSRLNHADQLMEYQKNCAHLQRLLPVRPRSMSHPCNSYSKETLKILWELGIRVGFRAAMSDGDNVRSTLEFPRMDHTNILRRVKPA